MNDWLIPYITFNGDCEKAVKFYQSILGGELQIMHFSDAPPNPDFPVNEAMKDLVLHAELRKDGHVLRFSDTFPNMPFTRGNSISFSLELPTPEKVQEVFKALSAGGEVEMEPQKTFFSPQYAKFTDQFGVNWQLTSENS